MYCRSSCASCAEVIFSPVGRQLAVHLAAHINQKIIGCARGKCAREFFFEHRQVALEVFEVGRPGRIDPRQQFSKSRARFVQTRGKFRLRATQRSDGA